VDHFAPSPRDLSLAILVPSSVRPVPNPSLQPTCYGWLRQPPQAAELKR